MPARQAGPHFHSAVHCVAEGWWRQPPARVSIDNRPSCHRPRRPRLERCDPESDPAGPATDDSRGPGSTSSMYRASCPCNLHRHNLFRPLIDTQVQLTPGSAPTMSMLSDVPFTRAVHSQARRIHNHVPRPTAWANRQERRQGTLSSTESAVVWNWQIESEQLQERRKRSPASTEG